MKDYKISINYVHFNIDAMIIGWSSIHGFGQLTVYYTGNHSLDLDKETYEFDTECMSNEFCKQVLNMASRYLANYLM